MIDDFDADDDDFTIDEALDQMSSLLDLARGGEKSARAQLVRLLNQVGAADRRVREDYEDRFAIELLQNAHDACYDDDGRIGGAWFTLTETALIVGNQGRPFDGKRITALTSLGETTKTDGGRRRHLIGYKGVGFSAVFSITDRPQIASQDVNFGFDRDRALQTVSAALNKSPRRLATRSVPFRLTDHDWEGDWHHVDRMRSHGAVTVIRLPLKTGVDAATVRGVLRRTLTPETLIFMPHLHSIYVDDGDEVREWTRSAGSAVGRANVMHLSERETGRRVSWLVRHSVAEAPEVMRLLEDEIWHDVQELNVSVALPWQRNRVDAERPAQCLHVYFPTDDQLGRAVLVHGDFFVHSSRRYIQDKGNGGKVSLAVAQRAAEMVAEMAEDVANRGGELLRALAVTTPPSGFGQDVVDLIDAALRDVAIARSSSRSELRRPRDLAVVDTHLDDEDHQLLVRSLREPHRLVRIEDDAGHAGELLRSLGSPTLTSAEIAERFSPSKAGSYAESLALLKRWWDSLSRVEQNSARPWLRNNSVVQDEDGRWRRPDAVRRYDRTVPLPPRSVRPPALKPPGGWDLANFATQVLGVESLSAANVLEHVLNEVENGAYGRTTAQARSLVTFLYRLWTEHPEVLAAEGSRLGSVRIPARAVKSTAAQWRAADTVYLPEAMSGDGLAEAVYGPFREPEFASTSELGLPIDGRLAEFLVSLGASVVPREVEIEFSSSMARPSDGSGARIGEWLRDPEVVRAGRCYRSHYDDEVTGSATVIDRLEAILATGDHDRLTMLAGRLGDLTDPFGGLATVRCKVQCANSPRHIASYQRWLLTTTKWISVEEAGRRKLTRPIDAWSGVPRSTELVLPATRLPDKAAETLGCIRFAAPTVAAVERTLDTLTRRQPRLEEATDALRNTLDLLLDKLDDACARERVQDAPSREAPRLPALNSVGPLWSRAPVVPDLPALDQLPGLVVLPPGQWLGLRAFYGLKRARDIVKWTIRVEEGSGGSQLPAAWRPELVAVLSRATDQRRIARKLGRLAHEDVHSVSVELVDGETRFVTRPLPFHLVPSTDPESGELVGGTLFTSPDLHRDLYGLSQILADYLDEPDRVDLINSYLISREAVLASRRITSSRIDEARAQIEKYAAENPAEANVARTLIDTSPWSPGDTNDRLPDDLEDLDIPWPDHAPPRQAATEAPARTSTADSERVVRSKSGGSTSGSGNRSSGGGGGGGATLSASTSDGEAPGAVSASWAIDPDAGFTFDQPAALGRGGSITREEGLDSSRSGRWPSNPTLPRPEVDDRAMKVAISFGQALGAIVRRVDEQNLGWDLEFQFGSDEPWPVEVKGMADERDGFVITRNELRAARQESHYRYLIVTGVRGLGGSIVLIEAAKNPLDMDRLEAMSWIVPNWRDLAVSEERIWAGACAVRPNAG